MMRGCCSMMRLHCFCRLLFGAIESYFCGKHAHGHTLTSGMLCGRDAGDYIALKRQALCEAAACGCCAQGGERGGGRIASSGGRSPVSSLLSDARPSPGPQRGAEGGGGVRLKKPERASHHTHSREFRAHRSRIMYSRTQL